jgi:hypothetical protein
MKGFDSSMSIINIHKIEKGSYTYNVERYYVKSNNSLSKILLILFIITLIIFNRSQSITRADAIYENKINQIYLNNKSTELIYSLRYNARNNINFTDFLRSERAITNVFKREHDNLLPKVRRDLGSEKILINNGYLLKYDLPDKYYKIDYSSFQPYMHYEAISNKNSSAYKITRHKNAYTDKNGFRRYRTDRNSFKVNNEDDYMIALGHHFNEKGLAGVRYLIVTTEGMYTAITGDVKARNHTDSKNMFSKHGSKAGMIEWIIDRKHKNLDSNILKHGTVTKSRNKILQGKVLYIYKICN